MNKNIISLAEEFFPKRQILNEADRLKEGLLLVLRIPEGEERYQMFSRVSAEWLMGFGVNRKEAIEFGACLLLILGFETPWRKRLDWIAKARSVLPTLRYEDLDTPPDDPEPKWFVDSLVHFLIRQIKGPGSIIKSEGEKYAAVALLLNAFSDAYTEFNLRKL